MEGKLRAVLFDMGGTLFTYERVPAVRAAMARELGQYLELDPSENERLIAAVSSGMARSLQEFTVRRFYLVRDMLAAAYRYAAVAFGRAMEQADSYHFAARASDLVMKDVTLREGTIETLQALRRRRLHVGVVSNSDAYQFEQGMAIGHVGDYLDAMVCSERARSCKPDSAIFKRALRQANCEPGEALFVGDSPQQDIAGAAGVGMRTALIIEETLLAVRGDMAPFPSDYVIHEIPEVLGVVDSLEHAGR